MISFSQIFDNDLYIALFIALAMIVTEYVCYIKEIHYSKDKKRMASHPLNSKYHFNRISRLDVKKINMYFCLNNLIFIIISTFIMIFYDLTTGFIIYLAGAVICTQILTDYMGKHISQMKLKK